MSPFEAKALGIGMLIIHGLKDWRIRLGKKKVTAGLCFFGTKTIEISEPFVLVNKQPAIAGLILHEIAHAISGRADHGKVWKAVARLVGADPSARPDYLERPPGKWEMVCEVCGGRWPRSRKPAKGGRWSCTVCGGRKFDERFLLRVEVRR